MSGFCLASVIGPSPSEREIYEATIRSQAEQLQEARDASQSGGMKPQEKQALIQLLSDLTREVKDLKKSLKEAQEDIEQIREYFPKLVSEDRKRIKDLERGRNHQSKTAQFHVSELYDHMIAIGRKQVSFQEAARCLKLSKSRAKQLKITIALDERFTIVHSDSHNQKELIRLKEI